MSTLESPRLPETTNSGGRRYCFKDILGGSLNTASRLSYASLSKTPSLTKKLEKGTNCLYDSSIATISEGVRPMMPSMIERPSQEGQFQDLCPFFEWAG